MRASTDNVRQGLWVAILGLALLTFGCAGQQAFMAGEKYFQQGNYDQAMAEFAAAAAADPGRHEYRMKWLESRRHAALAHFQRGREQARQGNLAAALGEYRQASLLDGSLTAAVQELKAIEERLRAEDLLREAEEFYRLRRYSQARADLEQALQLVPGDERMEALLEKVRMAGQTIMDGYELELTSRQPLSLQFVAMDLRQAFAVLSRLSGIHFILDADVVSRPVSLLLKKASFAQVLDLLLKLNGLDKRVLNSKTILVYPKTSAKEKQYEDRVIQVFYLSNIAAKKAVNMLRTMLQVRKIYVHEELNALILRDKPEVIRLARQILEAADRTDSEVVFDLELVEVSHRNVLDLGPKLSSYSISAGFGQSLIDSDGNIVTELVNDTLSAGGSTDNLVRGFSGLESFYTLPTATFDFAKTLTDSEILANPKIRVKNREKAKVHIGTREPIVTTNISTTTGDVTSTNVQYIDVGVKLDVAPSIQLDDTIVTTIKLEVSSVLEKEEIAGGGVALRLSTTNAESALILKDGERTIIGGLIRNDLSNTRNTLPLLGDIPLLGELFTNRSKEKNKREILLSITPHIVRSIDLPRPEVATIWSGSEDDPSDGPRFAAFASEFRTSAEVLEDEGASPGESDSGQAAPSPEEGGVTLNFAGPPVVEAGQEFHVELMVSGVRDLHQAVATVAYPADLFELIAGQRGPMFGRDQSAARFTMTPSTDRGQATLELRQQQQQAGVSGSGPLFSLVFRGKAAGNGVLRLAKFALRDHQGQVMDAEARVFSVEVR